MPKGGGPYKLQPTACASQVFLGFPLNKVSLISIFDILLFCFHKYYVWFSFHFFIIIISGKTSNQMLFAFSWSV